MSANEVANLLINSKVSKEVEPEEVNMNVKYLRNQYIVEIMVMVD